MCSLIEYLNRAKETNESISALSECVSVADALKAKSASALGREHQELVSALSILHSDFKNRSFKVKDDLEMLREENQKHLEIYGCDRAYSAKNTHFQSLKRRFSLAVEDFRRIQTGFLRVENERLKTQYLIACPNATEEELSRLEEEEKAKSMLQTAFTLGSKSEKDVIIQAERRRSSIEGILRSISEIKEIASNFADFIMTSECDVDRVSLGVKSSLGQSEMAKNVISLTAVQRIRTKEAKRALTLSFFLFLLLIFGILILRR